MTIAKQSFLIGVVLLSFGIRADTPARGMKPVEDSYIVQFQEGIGVDIGGSMLAAVLVDDGAWIEYRYEDLFPGVSLRNVSDSTLAKVKTKLFVHSVTPDTYLELDSTTQDHPLNWGLDRIDERELPMDGFYKYRFSGLGTEIYVLDTGIYMDHKEFSPILSDSHHHRIIERTVSCGYDVFGGACNDEIGHGTYVAGIAAGTLYGVAKKANIVAVKIYNHAASVATALKGFEYVLQQKQQARNEQPMVINLSLSGTQSDLLNHAVETLTTVGVVVVVSAGNRAADSCQYSPASAASAIAVSATDYKDNTAPYANYGECVAFYAPGHQIPSAWIRSYRDKAILSGTSGASAHVAGVVAQYLEAHRDWKPNDIAAAIKADAINTTITNTNDGTGAAVLLLHNGDLKY